MSETSSLAVQCQNCGKNFFQLGALLLSQALCLKAILSNAQDAKVPLGRQMDR